MGSAGYIRLGLADAWGAVKAKKFLFLGLVVLQFVALVVFMFLFIHFQVKIITSAQDVVTLFAQANYNPDSLSQGSAFMKDIGVLNESYTAIKQNIVYFSLALFFYLLTFQGWLWLGAHALRRSFTRREFLHSWKRYGLVVFILFAVVSLISYLLIRSSIFTFEVSQTSFVVVIYSLVALYGLGFIVFLAGVNVIDRDWKDIKKIVHRMLARILQVLFVFFVSLLMVAVSVGILVYTIYYEPLNYLLFVSSPLFFVALVFSRLFIISALRRVLA